MRIIDFHAHILPKVDHGSPDLEVSLRQLEMAKRVSVSCIFSTSHFYPHMHSVEGFLKKRNEAYRALVSHRDYCGIDIRLGAEVLLCVGLENLPDLESLCLFGSNTLLLELPFNEYSDRYTESIVKMIENGFEIVLAHADRYDREIIDTLVSLGCKVQLNCDSLCGLFPKRCVFDWIRAGAVVGLGSDIHMLDRRAYKCFTKARARIGEERFQNIMEKSLAIFDKTKPIQ